MKNPTLLSDEQLVEFICKGNQESYKEVVTRYQKKLIRYAVYLLHDQQDAVDVVQDSFIKAFINLNGFDVKKKFSSWIYRIVHNEAMNYINKKKRYVFIEDNEWIEQIKKEEDDMEEKFDKKMIIKKVEECLKDLSIEYREPLALFYLEEKSYDEISDVLRIPIGTVGTRINRAKKYMSIICKRKKAII